MRSLSGDRRSRRPFGFERMANLPEPLDGGRVDLVATQVARVWEEHRGQQPITNRDQARTQSRDR